MGACPPEGKPNPSSTYLCSWGWYCQTIHTLQVTLSVPNNLNLPYTKTQGGRHFTIPFKFKHTFQLNSFCPECEKALALLLGEHSRHFSSVARYPTGLLLFIILWLLCCSQLDLLINFCTEKDGHKQGAERCFPP